MIASFTVIPTCNLHVLHHADIDKFCAGVVKENQTFLFAYITVHLGYNVYEDMYGKTDHFN